MSHTTFATTSRGLDRDSFPMRLFEKAKRLGIWNPSDIDLVQDQRDWATFNHEEKELIYTLLALFVAGEEAVTLDLLPLIEVMAREGRIEEELYLTTFLFEEAKHTDFFQRVLHEVCKASSADLAQYHTDSYRLLVAEALPDALLALRADPSPAAQIRASVTYNMIVEGVLAETGYHAFFTMLQRNSLMPGLQQGIGLLKQDESRHIAYGLHLLSRLVAAHPQEWATLETQMNALLVPAINVIAELFARFEVVPFGLVLDDFVDFAMSQFAHRYERLEAARQADK
ncbi:MAG: R2-like ligand-binding oxidase [Caldilineales bacterium]